MQLDIFNRDKGGLPLPRTDKYGRSYTSYSQIELFKRDRNEFKRQYIDNEPWSGNAYTEFGSRVGFALEHNDYSTFTNQEAGILRQAIRLDKFETRCRYLFDGFYILGFIDTHAADFSWIIDYKTGGRGKEFQYSEDGYKQLCYYALCIQQEYGVTPQRASVNFIRRSGNAFRGERLKVDDEQPILIDVDITQGRLQLVKREIIETVSAISEFYLSASTP